MTTSRPLAALLLAALAATAPGEPAKDAAATYSREKLLPLVSSPGKEKNLFTTFTLGGKSPWNPDFWGASLGFEQFTGIGWGTERAGVLVTPEHVLSAAHFGNNAQCGVDFYGADGSFLGHRSLALDAAGKAITLSLPNDIRVARLESPAPAGARIYPLPDPATHAQRLAWGKLPADQRPLLLATDWRNPRAKKDPADPKERLRYAFTRSAQPVRLAPSANGILQWSYGPTGDPAVHPSYHEVVNKGDSSHPLFWITRSGLVLASTFSSTVAGPDYGDPANRAAIQKAINTLGGTKDHSLRTAPVP